MKIKYIDKRHWSRVIKRKMAFTELKERAGFVSLLQILEVQEPLIKPCFGKMLTLADVGYYWLQIGIKDANFWLTAMYDQDGNFIEYYFDITKRNVIDGKNSSFEDLYLDINVGKNNEIELLDEDELLDALKNNYISREDFELSHKVAKEIMQNILKNRDKCDKICRYYFNLLKDGLIGE